MKGIIRFLSNVLDGYGDGIAAILGYGVLVRINDMMNNSVDWANFLVSWGMVFIVGYGVLRITLNLLWNILFAKNFSWKVGILDKLFRYLRPVRAQEIAEATDEEIQEKALQYMRKLGKVRMMKSHGGVKLMGIKEVFKTVKANKWTIAGVGALGVAGLLAATGAIDTAVVEDIVGVVQGTMPIEEAGEGLFTAAGLGVVAALSIKAALGKGVESVEQYEKRIEAERVAKEQLKEAKANGQVVDIQAQAEKLSKKLHIPIEKATEIVKAQQAVLAQEAAELAAQKKAKKVAALAKKLHISEEQAKQVVDAQTK